MRQHFMKKHGSKVYKEDSNVFNQDHVCLKGFSDSYTLCMHKIAKSGTGSHVNNIFADFDVTVSPSAKFVTSSSLRSSLL